MSWPKPLVEVSGPMRADKIEGAALGMGDWGARNQALFARGIVQPDMLTGLTLFLLSNQPRDPKKVQKIPGGAGGVAGGVWVRERFTISRPMKHDEAFIVQGDSVGRHVHKGRRYGTTRSETLDTQGKRIAQNLTTGLLAYKVQEGLEDSLEGEDPDLISAPTADRAAAMNNPCLAQLATLKPGCEFGGHEVNVSLAMMQARDTQKPDNPIHSDPELARKAGLSRPIAGGSHVLAFVCEAIMQEVGEEALLHGANFDVRWKAPVHADSVIFPSVQVAAVSADLVVLDCTVRLADGAIAMVSQIRIPLT